MPIFLNQNDNLKSISELKLDLEVKIQKLTEKNLNTIFGLTFVSGASNQEFSVRALEQDFYIDTLAFDEAEKTFVIIEYKKDKSFSVIDQGFAYLSAMLNHKADFILELNERLVKNYTKKDINWEQSRVIFISPEFTNYQRNAINFKDLPIYLYEVRLYENGLVEYDPIKPYRTTESISKISKDKTIQTVTKEVKVYTIDDLIKPEWTQTRELYDEFDNQMKKIGYETRLKFTKLYVAYMSKHGKNYVEIVPRQYGLNVYYRFPANLQKSNLKIEDVSNKGHWTNGNSFVSITDYHQIPEAISLAKDSYTYIHPGMKGK